MEENYFLRAMGSALAIFMAGVISAIAIWSVRRFLPRKAAYWLTTPVGALIRRLRGRELLVSRQPSQPDQAATDHQNQRQATRD